MGHNHFDDDEDDSSLLDSLGLAASYLLSLPIEMLLNLWFLATGHPERRRRMFWHWD